MSLTAELWSSPQYAVGNTGGLAAGPWKDSFGLLRLGLQPYIQASITVSSWSRRGFCNALMRHCTPPLPLYNLPPLPPYLGPLPQLSVFTSTLMPPSIRNLPPWENTSRYKKHGKAFEDGYRFVRRALA